MTDAIRKHLLRYPHARSTSLAYQQMKAEKTAQLRAEVAAARPTQVIRSDSVLGMEARIMAFEIRKSQDITPFPKRKPTKNKGYLAFIHSLPCCVSGEYGVEAAHLSSTALHFGHYGRGKSSKAPDRWALPLSPTQHRIQHSMNEMEFWKRAGIDPHVLALTIFGLWSDIGDDAEPFAAAIINQHLANANRLRERADQ